MTSCLADANVLIALSVAEHVHHQQTHEWFSSWSANLATCPITEGALVRFLVRERTPMPNITQVLAALHGASWHEFWPDDVPYGGDMLAGVIGHRQVTDAYLVALAASRQAPLVTLDRGLAAMHGAERTILIDG